MEIDWSDLNAKISNHFTVNEATYLPSWKTNHNPSDEEKANILKLAAVMDQIRDLVGASISVNVWIRPSSLDNPNSPHNDGDYNALIGGAHNSSHITGEAVDFEVSGMTVDEVLDAIEPKCMDLGFTLENNGSAERIASKGGSGDARNWVHASTRPLLRAPIYRIFNP